MAYRDQFTIRQGKITLYRRTSEGGKYQSDNWYCALKIPNKKTIRRSLKTFDRDTAERLAEDLWYTLDQRSSRGLSLGTKRFELVAKLYLKDLEDKGNLKPSKVITDILSPDFLKPVKRKRTDSQHYKKGLLVSKYLIPYFKEKNIQEITDQDVIGYTYWRKNYWINGDGSQFPEIEYIRDGRKVRRPKSQLELKEPSWNTINKDLTVLRQIFEFARLSNILEGREVPTIKNLSKPHNSKERKPSISGDQVKLLIEVLLRRYESQKNPKHKRSHKLLIHYIIWMCSTGMRVSEAKNLRLSDCKMIRKGEHDYLKVFVKAKGKSRELIAQSIASKTLSQIYGLHHKNCIINNWRFSSDMYMFSDQYGKRIGSFASSLNRALKEANLLYDAHGVKRSGGAFRKYYITTALLAGKINYFELAKQTGTSISVIEKYYADIDITERPQTFIFEHALAEVYERKPRE